jgi:chemotaxis response regulator CheB
VSENPIPVVVLSTYMGVGVALGIDALEAGGVDVVLNPQIGVRDFPYESAVTLIDAMRGAAKPRRRFVMVGRYFPRERRLALMRFSPQEPNRCP